MATDNKDLIGETCNECGEELSMDGTCRICSPNESEDKNLVR